MNIKPKNQILPKITRTINSIPTFLSLVFSIYLLVTIILCAFCTRILGPGHYTFFTINNVLYFALAVGIFPLAIIIAALLNKFTKKISYTNNWLFIGTVVLLSCLLLIYFVFMIIHVNYVNAGDMYDVTLNCFQDPNMIKEMESTYKSFYEYFSTNQNTIFQLGMFSKIYTALTDSNIIQTILSLLNKEITTTTVGSMVFKFSQLLGCAGVWGSCILVSVIIKNKINTVTAIFCLVFSVIFIAISPIAIMPYSDSYSILFTTAALASYILIKDARIKYPFIVIFSLVGYALKPTAIAILIAIVLVELCSAIGKNKHKRSKDLKENILTSNKTKYILQSAATTIVSLCLVLVFINYVKDVGVKFDDNKQLTYTHFLALGANTESDGVFDSKDYETSSSAKNVEEREKNNIELFNKRLSQMGISGALLHYTNKNIQNYSNGTMCPFYYYKNVQIGNENPIIRAFYGIRSDNGNESYNSTIDSITPYNVISQILWFFILICVCFAAYKLRRNKYIQVAVISLLMLSIFLIIFEASCRYLFLYKAYFLLIGVFGLFEIWKLAKRHLSL